MHKGFDKWIACLVLAIAATPLQAASTQQDGFAVPDIMRSIELFPIKAPPGADETLISVTSLPLEQISDTHWRVPAGTYQGNYVLDVPIHLECAEGAVFDAQGQKNAMNIRAPKATFDGCRLINWGANLTEMDSGIFIERTANGSKIINNSIYGPGFGIWMDAVRDVRVEHNQVQGHEQLRSADRGNGIHIFATKNCLINENRVWHVRDGIYIEAADDNDLTNNDLHDLRYGIHYMFSHRSTVTGNRTTRTRTGYALMQSRQLTVEGNYSDHDDNYGILLNYLTYSTVRNNHVTAVQSGVGDADGHISGAEGKGLFIFNSLFNVIAENTFGNSAMGVHLTAGSEDNHIYNNAFYNNEQQVKYVALRNQEWSHEGIGNYWSDYLGWDRNADGIGDVPYEPNDNVDRLLWTYPQVRLLMHSPVIEVLRWVQRAFPVVRYPGVQDSFPLMRPAVRPPAQGVDL